MFNKKKHCAKEKLILSINALHFYALFFLLLYLIPPFFTVATLHWIASPEAVLIKRGLSP